MSKENVKEFYRKLSTDKGLQKKLANEKTSKERIVEIAKEQGLEFTAIEMDDFLSTLTVAEADELLASDVVDKNGTCYCFLGGGGNVGGGVCTCVGAGAGVGDDGSVCACVAAGGGC